MSKNLMLQFKLKIFIQKNMQFHLFSHIALFYGQTLIKVIFSPICIDIATSPLHWGNRTQAIH
jgi:hypothetical protein